jgi:hypothetical protein
MISFESPEVQSLLVGVYKCSAQTYHRLDPETGKSTVYPIRRRLMELGMCSKTASLYLKKANLPLKLFARQGETAPAKAPKKCGPTPLTEEEREEKRLAKESLAERTRFQLITTNSGRYGVFDGFSGRVVSLFLDPEDAEAELTRLRSGKSYTINNN